MSGFVAPARISIPTRVRVITSHRISATSSPATITAIR